MNKNTTTPPPNRRRPSSMRKYAVWGLISLFILSGILLILPRFSVGNDTVIPDNFANNSPMPEEPAFLKEGELTFQKSDGKSIAKVDIEIVEDERGRQQGLMYRRSMASNAAMLFIFEQNEPQSFWMKNTYIPLDIIYVDDKMTIVSIQKNAQPLSEQSLPSAKPAKFVVEVNAGFCDGYGIKEGDKVNFVR